MSSYVMYNPVAGGGSMEALKMLIEKLEKRVRVISMDIRNDEVLKDVLRKLRPEDELIVAGGDGTLNRFVNRIGEVQIPCDVKYYPVGSGNDFAKDMGKERGCEPFSIKEVIRRLPTMEINGRVMRFFNGAGVGLDGHVCREVQLRREKTDKPVNYMLVAVQSLFAGYRRSAARITVDGVTKEYKKVWIAATMQGRYFGGGMKVTPPQDRNNAKGYVTSVVYFGLGKLLSLVVFGMVFSGKHLMFKKNVILRQGKVISVEMDRPCTMQVDGEIIENVTSYTVRAADVQ